MNHKGTTLAVAAIIAAAAMTGVAFAIPQQVMAGGHGHGHHNNHNNHNDNGVKVDQQVNQLNACGPQSTDSGSGGSQQGNAPNSQGGGDNSGGSDPGTICANFGANSADIHSR